MENYRKKIKDSDNILCCSLKVIYDFIYSLSFPAPKIIYYPVIFVVNILKHVLLFIYCQIWVIPNFKTIISDYGKHLKAGIFPPFVIGNGRITVGNDVIFHGKADFIFGAISKSLPELIIGNKCSIGHNVTFDISGTIKIGNNCLIARNVIFQDCNGHHIDPKKRQDNVSLTERQIRPIRIGDNVWIGTNVHILPGATIGSGCVIGSGVVVKGHIPENSILQTSSSVINSIIPESLKMVL